MLCACSPLVRSLPVSEVARGPGCLGALRCSPARAAPPLRAAATGSLRQREELAGARAIPFPLRAEHAALPELAEQRPRPRAPHPEPLGDVDHAQRPAGECG